MKTYSCNGYVKDGALVYRKRSLLERWLRTLKDGASVWITVELGSKRSNEFNRYYFGACQYVADKLAEKGCPDWTNDDVHEYSKKMCNSVKRMLVNMKTGELIEETVPQSTANFGTARFLEYKERFMQLWAEEGIYVPDSYWEEE